MGVVAWGASGEPVGLVRKLLAAIGARRELATEPVVWVNGRLRADSVVNVLLLVAVILLAVPVVC